MKTIYVNNTENSLRKAEKPQTITFNRLYN